jgi:hypothetical protein
MLYLLAYLTKVSVISVKVDSRMIREWWMGKDFLGSDRGIIQTLSWYLPPGTEENHYILYLFLEKCIHICVWEILTLSFASLPLEYILLREAEVCFLALFVERIFEFLETGAPVQRIFDNLLK